MRNMILSTALTLLSAPAFADGHVSGDAVAGEGQFNRQCVACHVVVNDDGERLAGRNARTGPNLFGMTTRAIASYPGFSYGDSLLAVGELGEASWTEADFVGYVQDPTGWIRSTLDNRRARSKMAFQVRREQDAIDIYAYLESLSGN